MYGDFCRNTLVVLGSDGIVYNGHFHGIARKRQFAPAWGRGQQAAGEHIEEAAILKTQRVGAYFFIPRSSVLSRKGLVEGCLQGIEQRPVHINEGFCRSVNGE